MTRLITDDNWSGVKREAGVLPRYLAYGSSAAICQGLLPVSEQPDLLVPPEQWKERIDEANAHRMFPIHRFEDAKVQPKHQSGFRYCWSFSLASVLEDVGLAQNLGYRRLSGTGLGHLVNWKNEGYWLTDALEGAKRFGIPGSESAPDDVRNPRHFQPGWQQDALRCRPLKWFDTIGVDRRRADEEEQVHQCVSLLLPGKPGYAALNWWGHAVMYAGLMWDTAAAYNLRWVIWNSHGDGRMELTGSHGVPDEFYSPSVITHDVVTPSNAES